LPPSGLRFVLMLAQEATGREVKVTPDGPSAMSGAPIKGGGQQRSVVHGGWHTAHHHQTTAVSLLSLSLVGLMTSVLAAAATVMVAQSVSVVLRLPTSANIGT